ncbi:MAG TPA: acetyltransferase [Bryobacteraceae bacterium]|nr:acetyltransferase [Bryobacteraceae bacterium]
MKKVVLFGTGDFARVACVYLRMDSPYEVAAFTANENRIVERRLLDLDVVPFETIEQTHPPDQFAMFVAIGFKRVNKARAEIYGQCKAKGYELITYINSKAVQWGEITVGDNCFIFENNVLQPFVRIGNDVIIWSGNHIGHDSAIGDHCFIASHAVISGNVKIGSHCFIGVNATFRDGISVAPECVIGAGAVILKDTKPGEVYAAEATPASVVPSSRLKSFQ